MFVTAVCLLFLTRGVNCFYEREARARVPAQAFYCRSLRHSDVADCWSCLCMFQSGLQHHAESRDHSMYRIICHEACEVGIRRRKSIIKMEELFPIRLKHKK